MLPEKFVLADRVLQVAPSPTLAVNAKAKALRAAGADILNFSVGEPDMSTPAHVCEAGKKAIDDGHTRYTPVAGILELREAVCAKLKKDQGWDYAPDQVQVSCGGKHGLYNIFQAILNPGDEAVGQPQIMVIDDDSELCESLWEILRERRYRVCIAHDVR